MSADLPDSLRDHRPSAEAQERAAAAGLDLEVLRETDPATYMMLCAVQLVYVAAALWDQAQPALQGALPRQQLFSVDRGERVLVLAFPGPGRAALERLDELLGRVAEAELARFAYYRVVTDHGGVRRELDLPTAPGEWRGELTMVGPFANEAQAEAWARTNLDPRGGVTFDALAYGGRWFADVFAAEVD